MENFKGQNAMTGRLSEIWYNGELLGECYAFKATVEFQKEKVYTGDGLVDYKMMDTEHKGNMELYKINSRLVRQAYEDMMAGKDVRSTIINKQVSGTGEQSERIAYHGVSFDNLTLADWNRGQITKQSIPFTYAKAEYLDAIE